MLNFVLPELFDDLQNFENWFNFGSSSTKDDEYIANEKKNLVAKLHDILRPFLLRRLKSDCELMLPDKKEYLLWTPMTKVQRDFYEKVKNKEFDNLKTKNLMNVLMQLKKVCNHPLLFDDDFQETNFKRDVEESGKIEMLNRLLPLLKRNNHKILIFSQMTKMMDILCDYLDMKDYKWCRIDGSVSREDREAEIKKFTEEEDVFVFLLSTRSGGLGLNLVCADTVIIIDSDWNPQVDLQAQDRVHRIGQSKPVRVFRFVTGESIEKKILSVANQKLNLERLVIQQGNFTGIQRDKQDPIWQILNEPDTVSPSEHGVISDKDLATLAINRRDVEIESGVGYERVIVQKLEF